MLGPFLFFYCLIFFFAGVLYNLLPLLQGPAYTATLRAMLSVLAAVLDVEVETLLLQLQSVPSGAEQGQVGGRGPVWMGAMIMGHWWPA